MNKTEEEMFEEEFPINMFPTCNEWLDNNKISPGMIKDFISASLARTRLSVLEEAEGAVIEEINIMQREVENSGASEYLTGKTVALSDIRAQVKETINELKLK